MEIWLPELKLALTYAEQKLDNFCQYVSSVQGAYHGIIFCMTSGEIWKFDTDTHNFF